MAGCSPPQADAFQFVIGVDIHDENDKVHFALRDRGIRNAQLMKTEGAHACRP